MPKLRPRELACRVALALVVSIFCIAFLVCVAMALATLLLSDEAVELDLKLLQEMHQ